MALGIGYVFSGPWQSIVEPRDPINLFAYSNGGAPTMSEFRWRNVTDNGGWSASVAGTNQSNGSVYILPANTWARDKIYTWSARIGDSQGWSDWMQFSVDTSGYKYSYGQVNSSATKIVAGYLAPPNFAYEIRVNVRDPQGVRWATSPVTTFIIHNSKTLVKVGSRWRGVLRNVRTASNTWITGKPG